MEDGSFDLQQDGVVYTIILNLKAKINNCIYDLIL